MSTAPAKRSPPELRLVHSDDLTGPEMEDLVQYINWADGIHSNLGAMLNAIEQYGAVGIFGGGGDAEDAMIAAVDRKTTFRRTHGVMMVIGTHARTITRAFLIDIKPTYVDKAFGRLSGIVLGLVDDVEALADACKRTAMGTATPADRKAMSALRATAQRLYSQATRAYVGVLRALPKQQVGPIGAILAKTSPPHRCRLGGTCELHICPCGCAP